MPAPVNHPEAPLRLERMGAHAVEFLGHYGPGAGLRHFFSPGRVNLFGGHLDYNGGPVMPTAIDRGTFIAVRPRSDSIVRMTSGLGQGGVEFDLARLPDQRLGSWVDYPLGVVIDLARRTCMGGGTPVGMDISFGGDLPIGSGLSSSASICVGTALMLDTLWGLGMSAVECVHAALSAEREFVGVQCGIMDPFAIGCARRDHILWLDCKDESYEHLPIDQASLAILVTDTGVKRELAASEFNLRVQQCGEAYEFLRRGSSDAECLRDIPMSVLDACRPQMDPVLARRAEHVIRETQRTFLAREHLLVGETVGLGACMSQTHASLRDLYDVSCPELDLLVEAARDCPQALGARLTGAGFGGCTVTLVQRGAEETVRAALSARFEAQYGRVPTVEVFGGDSGPREIQLP